MLFALTITIQVGYKLSRRKDLLNSLCSIYMYYIQFQQSTNVEIFHLCLMFWNNKRKQKNEKIKLTTYDSKQH